MVAGSVFFEWSYHTVETEPVTVFPDGCRDVLLIDPPGARAFVTLTSFDFRPRHVALPRGTQITGYRLRPGSAVDQPVLDAIAADPAAALETLSHDIGAADDVGAVIDALALAGISVSGAARSLGTSVRTLQRHLAGLQLPPPDYWRLLARARRATAMLADHTSLTDVAHSAGFTDQAHMTREFVRWFSQTPGGLRRQPKVLNTLRQPALGNWTGEQISTR
ncbi:AraC family transcriptional regulator [Thioalkalivibrio paradoxus]|uniref:AraC family transcriptional regulator n=1 Tax=Thioalkalivibrio paradoxus ARh 1 TaxID=713585 RepID=W0DKU7_9GAMM|nr:helix-turn-helix domain-containing protein [Thioalkalivibrio paradoxus]AHE97515.1 AraC family transcriptional regulator [Thioalkalivibrio paradoxus ARh 1]